MVSACRSSFCYFMLWCGEVGRSHREAIQPIQKVVTLPTATFQVQASGVITPIRYGVARPAAIPTRVPALVARRVRIPSKKAPTVGPEA